MDGVVICTLIMKEKNENAKNYTQTTILYVARARAAKAKNSHFIFECTYNKKKMFKNCLKMYIIIIVCLHTHAIYYKYSVCFEVICSKYLFHFQFKFYDVWIGCRYFWLSVQAYHKTNYRLQCNV